MNPSFDIRDAVAADAEGIAAIYNHAVLHTTAIWIDTPVDIANRAAWLAGVQRQGYPVLVAVDADASVLGYAAFGDWRPFDGDSHTVEHSIYIRHDARGRGVGKALMEALIARAKALGKHAMIAAIDAGNPASLALHVKLGFREVGLLPQVGMKFGKWLDLAFLQLMLDDRATPEG
ncbi:GNAT family N-acetyltransferase [Pleomorphomonas sp. JP5]|uniref:GNAT family N-acetyltransferase n=1 Tax=Pleomorphomonas sp. JP5 TaxID=2942998 RepID=UPI002042F87E|nr:GNAT family N-acetyltransferase [Pleomorphomonas sp. JP5]MCM5557504.1 GNAT family N-acetyltransferase [Pleomorphomonas sp. JP5]